MDIRELRPPRSDTLQALLHDQCMLKGKVKGIYLRGGVFWYARQVNGRRTWISLETNDYAEAVQRARKIMEQPELQPAQALMAEVQRFLKHKYETNRFSKMSAESKGSILEMFADSVKNIPPAQVTTHQCKAFYNVAKARVRSEHSGKLHVYGPLVLQLVRR